MSDERHLKFEIVGTDESIDLSKSMTLLKMKIVKAGGENIDDNVEVDMTNHAGATMFEKLEIGLGSTMDNVVKIDCYHYIAYLN